jgi:serine/threonine-protein kinase
VATYELLDQIGAGGMAVVHRARQRLAGFDRIVAIKQMQHQIADRVEIRERFTREAQIMGALAHANIVQVYDVGDGYIALEYLEGWSLLRIVATAVTAGIPVPLGVILSVLYELCDALDHVHTRCGRDGRPLGIVHRDLSLGNLFVTRSGHLKLIDFGIATAPGLMADDGRICGKPSYMAPEVIRGRASDARADVFAVGVLAWELLAGRRLFTATCDEATLRDVLRTRPAPPSEHRRESPPMLDSLVLGALAKDPDKRTPSAAILRDQLEVVMRACEVEVRSSMVARWLAETGLDAMAVSESTRVETPANDLANDRVAEVASLVEPRTATPLSWQPEPDRGAVTPRAPTSIAWQTPALRSPAPVSWSRAAVLAVAIVIAPIALAARGGHAASERARAAVAMTVTQIEPAPAAAPVVIEPAPVIAKPAASAVPATVHVRRAPRAVRPVQREEVAEVVAAPALAVVASIATLPAPTLVPAPAPVAVPRAAGPTMIRPDEVRRLSGEIERIDGRRVDRDGGPTKLSAVLCIDARGIVSSVKLLAATPAWLGETLVRDLRAFRFTSYRGGAACFVRQLAID